jgi:hypothetical protein
MKIDLPLFEAVLGLDESISARFFQQSDGGLDLTFTRLEDLKNGGYYCTPANTLAFAWTGVDGEHFSFLVRGDGVDARSPVIFTAPMNYSDDMIDTNVVVAENFLKFVCLWLRFGAVAIGSMAWNPDWALAVYTSAEPPAGTCDDAPNNQEQEILNFALETLGLQPYIYTVAEFWALQERYMPELQMSADFCEIQDTDKLWNLERARLKRSPDPSAE